MVILSFVKYGNIHNALNFTFSIPCDAYLDIFYGLLHTFSSGPLRFCQQKPFSSLGQWEKVALPRTVPQLCVPQQSSASQPPRLVSRSGQLQEQGFSVEFAERIAAPQRSSTRTIYKSKWALFEKWYRENLVDFSTPSVKQVSHFLMYLYQDLNRRPSTIDGYRTAIVDTLGPAGLHVSQSRDLNRLLSSFHRDHPKSSRNLPKWNLSVLSELTKAPFEPMKDTDLKHLTLKTAFLLALASDIPGLQTKSLIYANGNRLLCSLLQIS